MPKVDIRMRLARQGLFSCLPFPEIAETAKGSSDGHLEDGEQLKGCITLWRTVIDRTLLYALSPKEEEASKAFAWLVPEDEKNRKSFEKVCSLAFLDSSWVSSKCRDLVEEFKDKEYFHYKE